MDIWSFLGGMMKVVLTSGAPEAAFTAFSEDGIEIKRLKKINELTYTFWIPQKQYGSLGRLCKKRGDILKIQSRLGAFCMAKQMKKRPVLLIGLFFLFFLVLWLPTRVFFVRVEGNLRIPERKILEAAQECGIGFGTSRREVRSERVKNALLSAVPELQWAGVNTSGCTATISVREGSDREEEDRKKLPASLVALRDGYILSCTSTRGSPLVKPGQSVQKGQILISAYTDCGLTIRAEQAEGEVLAQTSREIEAVTPSSVLKKGEVTAVKRKISLLIGKKRINLWKDSGIWEGSCGRMYEEYYITLPGGFQLPAALCLEEYVCADLTSAEISSEEAEAALNAFAEHTLTQQMVAGKILSGVRMIQPEDGVFRLRGRYACIEMIGKLRQEQIGDTNGKIN